MFAATAVSPDAARSSAVIWQLGLLHVLGYGLNAYSILVPFLVFAIGSATGCR